MAQQQLDAAERAAFDQITGAEPSAPAEPNRQTQQQDEGPEYVSTDDPELESAFQTLRRAGFDADDFEGWDVDRVLERAEAVKQRLDDNNREYRRGQQKPGDGNDTEPETKPSKAESRQRGPDFSDAAKELGALLELDEPEQVETLSKFAKGIYEQALRATQKDREADRKRQQGVESLVNQMYHRQLRADLGERFPKLVSDPSKYAEALELGRAAFATGKFRDLQDAVAHAYRGLDPEEALKSKGGTPRKRRVIGKKAASSRTGPTSQRSTPATPGNRDKADRAAFDRIMSRGA